MNRKDPNGRNIFGGGFLGLDNIGKNTRVIWSAGGGGRGGSVSCNDYFEYLGCVSVSRLK